MLKKMKNLVVKEEGQALTEYGLIIGLIAVVTIGVLTTMGGQIDTLLGKISTGLKSAGTP